MKVRKSIIHKLNNDAQVRKALALSLYCKDELGIHYVKEFTYNKLHVLTGIHVNTLKKRIRTLMEVGLAFMEGRKLVFNKVHKDNNRNNIILDTERIHTLKDYEYAIISLGIAIVQANKIFAKSVIDKCTDPKNLKEYKSAKKLANAHGYGRNFVDNGISYEYMANKFGISVKTACSVVKFAVKNLILCVKKNFEQIFVKSVNKAIGKFYSEYTFSTKNNIYVVHANSYSLGHCCKLEILDCKK